MIVSPAFFHGSKTVSVSSLARVQGRRGRDGGRGTGKGEGERERVIPQTRYVL